MQEIKITGTYITLGQLIKKLGLVENGGQAKWFLKENEVIVNGKVESRRGRKIYPQDVVIIANHGTFRLVPS